MKLRFEGNPPSDKKGALSYKSAAQALHDYKTKGAKIYPMTKNYSMKGGTTSVRFGGGQDKKVLELKEGKRGKYYGYSADPAYKGKSKHHTDLRKSSKQKALDSFNRKTEANEANNK